MPRLLAVSWDGGKTPRAGGPLHEAEPWEFPAVAKAFMPQNG